MDFLLLGPVQALHDGRPVAIVRRQERCLLGILLLEAGHLVPVERLLDLLWDGDPADSARRTLHTYMSRLRAGLAPRGLRFLTRGDAYSVDVDPSSVDAHRFSAAVAEARQLIDLDQQAQALRRALLLWRGPLLADAASDRLRTRVNVGLDELRMFALEQLAAADLAGGRYDQVIGDLGGLAGCHPTRERLVGLLMTALYRAGRQVDALRVYLDTSRELVAGYGVEPGPQLRALHEQVLRHEPSTVVGYR